MKIVGSYSSELGITLTRQLYKFDVWLRALIALIVILCLFFIYNKNCYYLKIIDKYKIFNEAKLYFRIVDWSDEMRICLNRCLFKPNRKFL